MSNKCSERRKEDKEKKQPKRKRDKKKIESNDAKVAFLSKYQEIKNGGWIPEPLYI